MVDEVSRLKEMINQTPISPDPEVLFKDLCAVLKAAYGGEKVLNGETCTAVDLTPALSATLDVYFAFLRYAMGLAAAGSASNVSAEILYLEWGEIFNRTLPIVYQEALEHAKAQNRS